MPWEILTPVITFICGVLSALFVNWLKSRHEKRAEIRSEMISDYCKGLLEAIADGANRFYFLIRKERGDVESILDGFYDHLLENTDLSRLSLLPAEFNNIPGLLNCLLGLFALNKNALFYGKDEYNYTPTEIAAFDETMNFYGSNILKIIGISRKGAYIIRDLNPKKYSDIPGLFINSGDLNRLSEDIKTIRSHLKISDKKQHEERGFESYL